MTRKLKMHGLALVAAASLFVATNGKLEAQTSTEVQAFNAQMIGSTTASRDNLYMGWYDYVVFFKVPQGRQWAFYPRTSRASSTLIKSTYTASDSGGWTYIVVTAGFRARAAATPAYNNRNPWEFANELRVRYR
jgi:hypothetical protein